MPKQKILIITPRTASFVSDYGDLIRSIPKKRYNITAVIPEDECRDFFESAGVKVLLLDQKKGSFPSLNGANYYRELVRIITEEKPDKVFTCTTKLGMFGSLAANKTGVKEIYALACELGPLFGSDSWKTKTTRVRMSGLYKRALQCNTKVIFQNKDDIEEFVKRGYAEREQCELVDSSGVNLKKFPRSDLPTKEISFLMVSRVSKEMGTMEYLKAAAMVKNHYPEVMFRYIGLMSDDENTIKASLINPYIEDGTVDYIPETNNIAKYIGKCNVFVLPSYDRDGIPKALLEAMAMGRPILTTDTPGHRETVINNKNGLFVQTKRAKDLALKMVWMIKHRDKLQKMGDRSYGICQKRFASEKVNEQMLKILNIA